MSDPESVSMNDRGPTEGDSPDALLTVRGLRVELAAKTERPVRLVDGVDLDLHAGELVGVVGETGAGKTLTMRAILGLLPNGVRASGALNLAGESFDLSVTAQPRSLLGRQTSVVLQNPVGMLDPLIRVGDQLVEGVVRVLGWDASDAEARARKLLTMMGFKDPDRVVRLYPHQLSGGMAQRVATAMGLMPQPKVLVLDEPTSALDANVRVEVMRLFQSTAREEQTGAFLVSHDLGLLSNFCDRIVVLYAGRVAESGTAQDVLGNPIHPYTRALLASSVGLDTPAKQLLPIIAGQPPRPDSRPPGCAFAPRCPHAIAECSDGVPQLTGQDHKSACIRFSEKEARA
jgi:oligopeptide/dipeptide ABC transporter ATP-binding protein